MSILFAISLVVLIGCSAVGVDIGSMFLAKRHLQGVADAAALATIGATDEQGAATAAVTASNVTGVRVSAVTDGSYTSDVTIAPDARFQPGATPGGATRVTLQQDIPVFFGRLLTGASSTTIVASATATRRSMVAFSIGSRLASVQGGLANTILSGLVGTDLGLTVMDYNALLGANVDILSFSDALRTQLHLGAASFGDTLNASATLPQVLTALAAASTDPAVAAKLRSIAARVPGTSIALSQLINLGPLADQDMVNPDQAVNVNTYEMLNVLLQTASAGRQVNVDVSGNVPGLLSTQLSVAIGQRPANSPWLSITADNNVVVRTAQARIYLQTALNVLGLGSLRVPLYIELAQAEARLKSVQCTGDPSSQSATLDVTPSVGEIAIADIDPTTLGDFSTAQTPHTAALLTLPLIQVGAFADIKVGGTAPPQSVTFTASDIAAGTPKTVSTNDVVQGIASSLANSVSISVNIAGLGLNLGLTKTLVATALTALAPLLDTLIDQVTGLLGIHLGQADVWVNRLRCGTPMLVG